MARFVPWVFSITLLCLLQFGAIDEEKRGFAVTLLVIGMMTVCIIESRNTKRNKTHDR